MGIVRMSTEGRIIVDALFHDADGLQSLKVLSLESSMAYDSGKVALVAGTCGTATASITSSTYRNAAGSTVAISSITRLAWSADNEAYCEAMSGKPSLMSSGSQVAASKVPATPSLVVYTTAGTASYTLLLWGES